MTGEIGVGIGKSFALGLVAGGPVGAEPPFRKAVDCFQFAVGGVWFLRWRPGPPRRESRHRLFLYSWILLLVEEEVVEEEETKRKMRTTTRRQKSRRREVGG